MDQTKKAQTPDEIAATLRQMIARKGADLYGGEQVTQEQHALQCAQLAENEGATPHLVLAALLHDIGHLHEDDFEQASSGEVDQYHEELGEKVLNGWFGPDVTEPVRLHVAAKRYLCAVEAAYFDTLSDASVHSLKLQGGPMSSEEQADFESNPFYQDAVRLRRWDDRGKDPDMQTADLDHFLALVPLCVRP